MMAIFTIMTKAGQHDDYEVIIMTKSDQYVYICRILADQHVVINDDSRLPRIITLTVIKFNV